MAAATRRKRKEDAISALAGGASASYMGDIKVDRRRASASGGSSTEMTSPRL
ncbi:hypothetical protein SJ05684_c21920 [Sinorhizobium sojae CCBAU 05684]|uniref:Uncharacterized protein n=1 Tax=Sinorhizobium sojae CCBAU 05684 TaxID=716928 RepID=A0A249PCH5_9HYPH|nr:hypothetical protein SJ05684_c21920 [Sinorhizobium sojae CCBAU 05684]